MSHVDAKGAWPRLRLDCPARIRLNGDTRARGAILKLLPGGGLLIWLDQQVGEGSVFDVTVEPSSDLGPCLTARVRALRCTPLARSEGSFAVACELERLED